MMEIGLGIGVLGLVFSLVAALSWRAAMKHARTANKLASQPPDSTSRLGIEMRHRALIVGKVQREQTSIEPLEGREVAFYSLRVSRYLKNANTSGGASRYKLVLEHKQGATISVSDGGGVVAIPTQNATLAYYWNHPQSHLLAGHFLSFEKPANDLPEALTDLLKEKGVRTRSILKSPERLRFQEFYLQPDSQVTVFGALAKAPDREGRPQLMATKKEPLLLSDLEPKELAARLKSWGGQRRLSAIVLTVFSTLLILGGAVTALWEVFA